MIGQRGRSEPLVAVDQYAKDDAPQRPGPLVDSDQSLKPAIARLETVGYQVRALHPQSSVERLACQLEIVAVNSAIHPNFANGPDIRNIRNSNRLAFREIDDRLAADMHTNHL